MAPTYPKQIGRYQIISQLAEGKSGVVFLAIHQSSTGTYKTTILKQIKHHPAWSPEHLAAFLEEARLTVRLNHANTVKTYKLLTEGHASYLVMEYLEGQSLFKTLQRLPLKDLPLEEHIWILAQALSGLSYAHTFSNYDGSPLAIIHGDMNPANVFITYLGEVKLLGFGMSKLAAKYNEVNVSNVAFSYHAPKQKTDSMPDSYQDVYSVGVMLREALLRIPLPAESTLTEPPAKQIAGEYEPLQAARPDLPSELTQLCDRTLIPNHAEVITTAVAFQQALQRYLAALPKPIEPGAVAKRLQTHFSVERQAMSKLIAEHMAIPQELNWVPPSGSDRHQNQVTTKEVPIVLDPAIKRKPFAAKYIKLTPLNFSIALIVLVVSIVAVIRWDPRPLPDPTAVPAKMTPPTAPKVTSAQAKATISVLPHTPPPATETVELAIAVTPKGAQLSLDGHVVAENPFNTTVPKDQSTHTISVTAPGFIPHQQQILFSDDLNLAISLRPHHTAIARTRKSNRAPVKEPPLVRPPSPPSIEPGMHLSHSPPRRTARQLDEKDPYLP